MSLPRQLRLLVVDNFQIRRYGKGREGQGYRFMCGGVRNNWRVMSFSERDITRYLAPLGFLRNIGASMMNRRLVETCRNFRPDFVLVGHCDYVTNETLAEIRRAVPGVRLAHVNVDPIWQEWTCKQIATRMDSCDAIFVTTAGERLKAWTTGKNVVGFLPNVCDETMEFGNVSEAANHEYDLFFAGRDAVDDERPALMRGLLPKLEGKVRLGVFGTCGRPTISGSEYERALLGSAAALSINRREGEKWYSSDRLAHIMGRGILAFISSKSGYQHFFADGKEALFFDGAEDLAQKVIELTGNPVRRAEIANAGRRRYHALFNSARVLRYMAETAFGEEYSENYEWAREVYQ